VAILRLMVRDWMPCCFAAPPHPIQPPQRHSLLVSSWRVVSCCVGLRVAPIRVRWRNASVEIITRILKVASRPHHMYWQSEDAVQVKFSITDLQVLLWATAAASGDCIRVALCTCVPSALALLVGGPFPLQSHQSHDVS
jgi:hypothetical protein